MGNEIIYRLNFKTQLHLGRDTGAAQVGSLGLEKTETYIPADTLFSAICQTWTTFYDTESLTDFLNRYTENSQQLPFELTSAFPFASDVYFYPKPLTWTDDSKESTRRKKSKRVRFVSESIFEDIISGKPPKFSEDNLINGGAVWVSPQERERLQKIESLKTPNADDLTIWKTDTRPRVTLGSRSAGSEIWHVESVTFNTDCGLWFAAKFNTTDATQQQIQTLLRVLGDTGIGGERNAGYGMFGFTKPRKKMPTVGTADRFITLSRMCPKSSEQLQKLLTGDVAYNLISLSGRMPHPGGDTRRKQITLFTEGSVLQTDGERIGRLVDELKPDDCPHPVYRYGYAWQVGIKGASA